MKKWEEDKNRLAHMKKLKGAKSIIDSNLKPVKSKCLLALFSLWVSKPSINLTLLKLMK